MSKYGLDKFYTNESAVNKVLETIKFDIYKTIIEPSAGNGSFSKKIPNCIAYDIMPEDDSIIKQDFLELEVEAEHPILIIGNPPFGRNGSLALKFIKHSCEFADTIAFILPKSFKKDSFYNKIPLNFWKIYEEDVEDFSFTFEKEIVNIPCVFQMYQKRRAERKIKRILTSNYFQFVNKKDANVAVRRVGVYAGKAFPDLNKSEQSHYFIKVDDKDSFINIVNSIQWGA